MATANVANMISPTPSRVTHTVEDGITAEALISKLLETLMADLDIFGSAIGDTENTATNERENAIRSIADTLAAISGHAGTHATGHDASDHDESGHDPSGHDGLIQQDLVSSQRITILTGSWSGELLVNHVSRGSHGRDILTAKPIMVGAPEPAGSVLSGGSGNDEINGRAGWDILDGGDGDDLIHGGNGRDILSGGTGRDELHGDFGWNTYRPERDGVSDLIAIKSDQVLTNWLYGTAGNNADGSKCDIIEGLDAIDRIRILGVATSQLSFADNINAKGVHGIGIYGAGALEAIYTGGDLTLSQITQMTSGDDSTAALGNQITSYTTW